jgi:heme-degrading monooxygenase HmoA
MLIGMGLESPYHRYDLAGRGLPHLPAAMKGRVEVIIRVWRAHAKAENAERYHRYFRDDLAPRLRRRPGFVDVTVGQRTVGDGIVEFIAASRWRSADDLKIFAGSAWETAVVEPVAAEMLTDFDDMTQNYEILGGFPSPGAD